MKRITIAATLVLSLAAAAALLAVDVSAGDRSPSPSQATTVSFMTFGEPEEIKAYRTLVSSFEKQNKDIDDQADRGVGPERPPGPALDVVRGRHAARPVPAQLPLLRAVRSQGRARARSGAR